MTERLPRWALYAFIVALPLHNLLMAELWDVGVRGAALDVVSAWKEVLLAAALAAVIWRRRGLPFKAHAADWLALAYAAFVVLYALIPQDWLGGEASARGVLYGLRHDLTPGACYFGGRWLPVVTALLAVGLLFTYSRTTIVALALGLLALGYALRSWWPVAAAAVFVAAAFFFVRAYPDIAPETRFTAAELRIQRAGGAAEPTTGGPFDTGESSFDSHLDNLGDGVETVLEHPHGYGVGNAGVTAKRTGTEIKAGESTFTELGVELGLLGMLAFIAWSAALAWRMLRLEPWLGAALVAVLVLGIQTDVIGVHWLAFVLWTLAGERA